MGLLDWLGRKKPALFPYSKRVPYKDEAYFQRYLQDSQETIELFIDDLQTNKVHPSRIINAYWSIYLYALKKLVGVYSSGQPIEAVKEEYLFVLEYFEKSFEPEDYEGLLWMLSLAILLEIEQADFDRIVRLLDQKQFGDYLLDTFVAYRVPGRRISNRQHLADYYQGALQALQLPRPQAEQRLRQYLQKEWYENSRDCYWYNTHMNPDLIYFGYWSFESGAIVKILGLDDTGFRNCDYYPYDLVHWQDQPNREGKGNT